METLKIEEPHTCHNSKIRNRQNISLSLYLGGGTKMFGGFSATFYGAYNEVLPLRSGWEERVEIYNLYHLLNHANLFGGGYVSQSQDCLKRLARMIT